MRHFNLSSLDSEFIRISFFTSFSQRSSLLAFSYSVHNRHPGPTFELLLVSTAVPWSHSCCLSSTARVWATRRSSDSLDLSTLFPFSTILKFLSPPADIDARLSAASVSGGHLLPSVVNAFLPFLVDACLPFSEDAYLPFWVDACSHLVDACLFTFLGRRLFTSRRRLPVYLSG